MDGRGSSIEPVPFSSHFRAPDRIDTAPVCSASAVAESGGPAGDGAGEDPGCCSGLRLWRCVEFQSRISGGVRNEPSRVSRYTRLMSMFSSTGLGAPDFAALTIARPTCSVVVTYFGHALYNAGSNGPSTV